MFSQSYTLLMSFKLRLLDIRLNIFKRYLYFVLVLYLILSNSWFFVALGKKYVRSILQDVWFVHVFRRDDDFDLYRHCLIRRQLGRFENPVLQVLVQDTSISTTGTVFFVLAVLVHTVQNSHPCTSSTSTTVIEVTSNVIGERIIPFLLPIG
jgi:hypothetical protein